jgi:hypothetical protein
MADAPLYKATLTKTLLDAMLALDPKERDAVLAELDQADVDRISNAAKTDWLPAEVQGNLDRAVYTALGEERLIDWVRNYTREASEIPVFAPIARGALTLFGGGAAGGLRILPKTWGFVARNCGRCLVERSDDGAAVSYVDLPEVMRTEWFVAAGKGGLFGLLEFVKATDIEVEVDDANLAKGDVHYTVRWRE